MDNDSIWSRLGQDRTYYDKVGLSRRKSELVVLPSRDDRDAMIDCGR